MMYWLFLIIFILIVLTPGIVESDVLGLDAERVESLAIFTLGVAGFLIYLFGERRVEVYKMLSSRMLKNYKKTSKDLIDTYGYIGELNRKMEILQSMSGVFPENSVINKREEEMVNFEVLNSINLVLKCKQSLIRFIDTGDFSVKKEIAHNMNHSKIIVDNKMLAEMDERSVHLGKNVTIIASPKKIDSVRSYAIIGERISDIEQRPDDVEMAKLFLSQVLFFYFYVCNQNNQGNLANK